MMEPAIPPRPVALVPDADGIPGELQARPQWVLWKYAWNGKKWTKEPYQASGMHASSTNPTTWAPLEQVRAAYAAGGFDGLGFVFTADDPFVGVDLDRALDPDTGAPNAGAAQILADFATYAELSPSGTGAHLICRGTLPGKGLHNQAAGIEMYETGRYFTVTGRRCGEAPAKIEARPAAVAALYAQYGPHPAAAPAPAAPTNGAGPHLTDNEILHRVRAAKNGPKFAALFDHGNLGAYESDSQADLAPCALLTFWTRDAAQLERPVTRSALGTRDKWQKRADYRALTIAHALSNAGEQYSGATIGGHTADYTASARRAAQTRARVSCPPAWRVWSRSPMWPRSRCNGCGRSVFRSARLPCLTAIRAWGRA